MAPVLQIHILEQASQPLMLARISRPGWQRLAAAVMLDACHTMLMPWHMIMITLGNAPGDLWARVSEGAYAGRQHGVAPAAERQL